MSNMRKKKLNEKWWNLRNAAYFHNMTDPDQIQIVLI